MIPATDFLVTRLPAIGSIQRFRKCRVRLWFLAQLNKDVFLCRTAVRWSFVPNVLKLAHAAVSNTVGSNIDHLVREPCHNIAIPYQEWSTNVEEHRSCHMQVSPIWQQYITDDLSLVAIDTRLHVSHKMTVREEMLFWNQIGKDSNHYWRPWGNLFEILVSWRQGNRFCKSLFYLSWEPLNIHMAFSWGSCPACPSLATQDLHSTCFDSSNCLYYPRASWTDASFRARDLILTFAPAALSQVAIQCASLFLVWPSTPLGTSICVPESLITLSSRSIMTAAHTA